VDTTKQLSGKRCSKGSNYYATDTRRMSQTQQTVTLSLSADSEVFHRNYCWPGFKLHILCKKNRQIYI